MCGVINPEDLYQIPETNWVIATGRISDSAGPIYAVNIESHQVEEIYPHNAALPEFDQRPISSVLGRFLLSSHMALHLEKDSMENILFM